MTTDTAGEVTTTFDEGRERASIVFAHPIGNILTASIVTRLRAEIGALATERHLRLVTIAGAGGDFSFGASVAEHRPAEIARVLPMAHALIAELLACPAPTAAVVRGRCLGGGMELALACDVIFAADSATFGLPEIGLGVFPPAAAVLLPLRVGHARAAAAVLTGATESAGVWHERGLVAHVWPEADLEVEIAAWFARTLARHSAEALRHTVRAARAAIAAAVRDELPRIEQLYLQDLMRSHDAAEGVTAFLEKRAPRWTDS